MKHAQGSVIQGLFFIALPALLLSGCQGQSTMNQSTSPKYEVLLDEAHHFNDKAPNIITSKAGKKLEAGKDWKLTGPTSLEIQTQENCPFKAALFVCDAKKTYCKRTEREVACLN